MTEPVKVLPMAQLLRLAKEKEARDRSQPSPGSQPEPVSLPVPNSPPAETSLTPDAVAYPPDSLSEPDSLPAPDSLKPDMWSPFREKKGHLRLPNSAVDGLYQMLDAYEQAVFTQLFRLSHGYGKPTCKIGLPQLARRSNVGKTTAQAAVNRLIHKGLVRKLEYEIGKFKEQGTTYWVSSPDSPSGTGSLPGDDTIKIKALKERTKREGSHERKDFSDCPDCQGKGFYWPEGYERGVAKCKHKRLS
jgi:hypothetical protein